jgi:hypothetical protein
VAILPMMSRSLSPRRRDGVLYYQALEAGRSLRADEVLHVPYLPVDGVVGRSPIALASRTIGTAIALDIFAAKYYKNGGAVGTVFELPAMSQEATEDTARQLREQYGGLENAHKIVAMPGIKPHKIAHSARDSQSVEARDWQTTQIAALFQMPIGILDGSKSHYAGLESMLQSYAESTLRPWAVLIEAEFNRKLFSEADQERYAVRFNLDAIIRASLSDRAEADSKLVAGGILTPNEARGHHDRPPVEGGDKLMSPLNMTPAADRSADEDTEKRSDPPPVDPRLRPLVEAVAVSVAQREAKAAANAAKRSDDFAAWASEWFAEHRTHLLERLPIISVEQAAELAERSRAAMVEAHASGTLDEVLQEWPETSKTKISTNLLDSVDTDGKAEHAAA